MKSWIVAIMLLMFNSGLHANGMLNKRASAAVSHGKDADTGLQYWQLEQKGISIRLVQRLPDQTRGYFLKRGFSLKQVELIAQSCVFQTIFRNTASKGRKNSIRYDLKQWQVASGKIASRMKTREDWEKIWSKLKIKPAAKIAFKWSLLPTSQVYQAGDYNWGMTSFDRKPGASFNLKLRWQQFGKSFSAEIKNIKCAPDIHPNPQNFNKK